MERQGDAVCLTKLTQNSQLHWTLTSRPSWPGHAVCLWVCVQSELPSHTIRTETETPSFASIDLGNRHTQTLCNTCTYSCMYSTVMLALFNSYSHLSFHLVSQSIRSHCWSSHLETWIMWNNPQASHKHVHTHAHTRTYRDTHFTLQTAADFIVTHVCIYNHKR